MSNFLAIATATMTLRQMLKKALDDEAQVQPPAGWTSGALGNADVSNDLPGDAAAPNPPPRINVYLYHVHPNAAWRNMDLPSRNENGQLIQTPQAALDLYYLLSFYGDEARLEPQRLLGIAVRTLHTQSQLTRQAVKTIIEAARNPASALNATVDFLASADLDSQIELVKFSPMTMNLDELSKLWTLFSPTPYVLSIAYQASLVLIDAKQAVQPGLPVLTRGVTVVPMQQPIIDSVRPEDPTLPLIPGSRFSLIGTNLNATNVLVQLGTAEVPVLLVTERMVTIAVPLHARAGVQAISIIHRIPVGVPPELRVGAQSNAAAVDICPVIDSAALLPAPNQTILAIHSRPAPEADQAVSVLLHAVGTTEAYRLNAIPAGLPNASNDPLVVHFDISPLPAGNYLVRIEIDGAPSPLQSNAAGFNAPTVALP